MNRSNFNHLIWVAFCLIIYLVLSVVLNRSLFTSEVDGFYYQVVNVSSGGDLGILSFTHILRYILVSPFLFLGKLGLPSVFDALLLFFYLTPIIFWSKIPRDVRFLTVLLLFSALFFSYRVVMLMASVFILVSFIKWNFFQFNYFLMSIFFGILSSGVLLILLVLFAYLLFKRNVFSKRIRRIAIFIAILLILVLLPSIAHKLLFFLDPKEFGSATSVGFVDILSLSLPDMVEIFSYMFDRSLVSEGLNNPDKFFRIYVFLFILILSIIYLIVSPGIGVLLFLFSLSAMIFEGLILYSLLFTLVALNYHYFYRRVLCVAVKS